MVDNAAAGKSVVELIKTSGDKKYGWSLEHVRQGKDRGEKNWIARGGVRGEVGAVVCNRIYLRQINQTRRRCAGLNDVVLGAENATCVSHPNDQAMTGGNVANPINVPNRRSRWKKSEKGIAYEVGGIECDERRDGNGDVVIHQERLALCH